MTIEGRRVGGAAAFLLAAGFAWVLASGLGGAFRPAVHGDGYYTYLWARSIVFDGDVDFGNDYRTCPDPWGMAHMPHGDAMNQWSPGAALFFAPILVIDRLTHHPALDSSDAHVANACVGVLAERAVRGSVVAGLLAMLLAFLAARRVASDGFAALAAVLAVMTGPVVYYVVVMFSYGHAASAALGGVAVWTWVRARTSGTTTTSRRAWLSMGVGLGLAMLARPQNAVLVVLPLSLWLDEACTAARGATSRESLARALAPRIAMGILFSTAMLATFGLQLYQWWHSTGELFLVPQGDYYLRPASPRVMNLLFSSANGLFTWCPIAYPAVFGLVAMALRRETRSLGVPLLVVLVLVTWLNACVADWWGAVGFAARRYDAMTVPFAMGIASTLAELVRAVRRTSSPAQIALAPGLGLVAVALATWSTGATRAVAAGVRSDLGQRSDNFWVAALEPLQHSVWNSVGNPLAWPASIPFALRYGVHPRVWDQASMPELFFHRWLTLETQSDLTTADLLGAHADLGIELGPAHESPQGTFRPLEGGHGRVLLPISYPHVGALRLRVHAVPDGREPVRVHAFFDDEDLGDAPVGGAQVELPVRRAHEGICVLTLRVEGGSLGLASVEIVDGRVPPSIAQARRNARLRVRRVAWRREHGLE